MRGVFAGFRLYQILNGVALHSGNLQNCRKNQFHIANLFGIDRFAATRCSNLTWKTIIFKTCVHSTGLLKMHRFNRWIRVALCCMITVIAAGIVPACFGQQGDAESAIRPEGRIVGKVWHTRIDFAQSFQFMRSVSEELGIPQSPLMLMGGAGRVGMAMSTLRGPGAVRAPQVQTADSSAKVEVVDVKGTLFLLQTVPTVNLENYISFRFIGSDDEFLKAVTEAKNQMGAAAELIGEGDFYEVKVNFSRLMAAPQVAQSEPGEDGEAPKPRQTFSIVISSKIATSDADPNSDAAAPAQPEMPFSMSTYYRYADGIMYECRSSILEHIDLPNRESLKLNDEEAANDLYADFDLTEVPAELKRVFWSAVEAQAGVILQRFDNEAEGDYSLRRVMSEGRLEILRAIMFDVDRARLSLVLPKVESDPITARLSVSARDNSLLAATLAELGRNPSQLRVLQDDESALVIASSVSLPDFLKPFGSAFVNSLGMKLRQATSELPSADFLIDGMMEPLTATMTNGRMDTAFCLRGTVESGLVPCAGLRLDDAESFLSSLQTFLQVTKASEHVRLTTDKIGDFELMSLHVDNAWIPVAGQTIPLQVNVCATGSWVWITVGGERSVAMLRELVQSSETNVAADGQAVPLLIRFRLNQWLGEGTDSLSQIPQQTLMAFEQWLSNATRPKMSFSINGSSVPAEVGADKAEFTSYAAKALHPESSEFELRVRSADREFVVDAHAGMDLVRFAVAQFLHSQSQMFKGIDFKMMSDGGGKSGRTFRIESVPSSK